jgi:hypothetical protein
MTKKEITQLLEDLEVNETMLVQAIKTSDPDRIQLEFAEKVRGFEGSASALIQMANADDDRFGKAGARRHWLGGTLTSLSKMFNMNFGDDADWEEDEKLEKEVLRLGVMNPTIKGHRLRVVVQETTTPKDDYQKDNVETTAKRRGKDGDIITYNGKPIFSNTVLLPLAKGQEAPHKFLQSDAVDSEVKSTSDDLIQDEIGM